MNRDLVGGLVALGIAAAYYAGAGTIADSSLSDEVGAAGLPHLLAYILAGLALILIGRALVAGRRSAPAPATARIEGQEDPAPLPRAFGFLLFGIAYLAILPLAGYGVAIALLIAGIALYEGAARTWRIPVIALAGAGLYWLLFVGLLGVNQPKGALFSGLFG